MIINKREIIDKTDLILKGSRLKLIMIMGIIITLLIDVLFGIVLGGIINIKYIEFFQLPHLISYITGTAQFLGATKICLQYFNKDKSNYLDIFYGFKKLKASSEIGFKINIFFYLNMMLYAMVSKFSINPFVKHLLTIPLMVLGVIKLLEYSMSFFIYCENPNLTVQEVLLKSSKMMKGYKLELFKLNIVITLLKLFLPMLLGAIGFLFFIGVPTLAGMVGLIIFILTSVIWILPHVAMANTIFYEKIKNKEESEYECQ